MAFILHRCCCKYDISDGTKLIAIYQMLMIVLNLIMIIAYKEWAWSWMLLFPLLSVLAMVRVQKKDNINTRRRYYIAMLV